MNLIIKGFIVGIGKIIPGVSGSVLAITLGIYEKIIDAISNIKKDIKKNLEFLSKIALGIILSITLTSKIIVKCLNKYYFPTMLLFIGMIFGGMPKIIKETKLRKKDIIITTIILLIYISISENLKIINSHKIEYTFQETTKLFGIGMLDAASSIIPGISGTALLMMLGYYNIILEMFASILNIKYIGKNTFIIIPFTLGFIIGTILISKIINILIKKNKNMLNIIILIFMTITTITLIKNTFSHLENSRQLIIGTILFIIGIIVSMKMEKNHK